MKWLDKLIGIVPLDYEKGFIDGFSSGLKFYKESIDMMHKAVLDSEQVRKDMVEQSKQWRETEGIDPNPKTNCAGMKKI